MVTVPALSVSSGAFSCVCMYSTISEQLLIHFRLAIGTDQGFALVDTVTNRCLYILSNLTSILCMYNPLLKLYERLLMWCYFPSGHVCILSLLVDTAAPSKYGQLKRRFDGTSPKPIIRRHPTLRSMSSHSVR